MINSRNKGKVGELELSEILRSHGHAARRGVQYAGSSGSPDVVGLAGYHIECKRVEAGNLYKWLDQAIRDADGRNTPIVCHRKNRREWVVILRLDDFLPLVSKGTE